MLEQCNAQKTLARKNHSKLFLEKSAENAFSRDLPQVAVAHLSIRKSKRHTINYCALQRGNVKRYI